MDDKPAIDAYIKWLETLGPQGCHRVSQFVVRDVRVRTPGALCNGPQELGALYSALFRDGTLVKTKVLHRLDADDSRTVFLRWDRIITYNATHKETLSGLTELMLDAQGKIAAITDYWDGALSGTKKSFLARFLRR